VYYAANAGGSINLQATLAASSSGLGDPPTPHHPISCTSDLCFHADNTLACEHVQAPAGDPRTQACLDHSIAVLLIEVLKEKESRDAG
jgi:hypothetical protein